MRTDGTVVAGGVVSTDRALGLPTEEREDRDAVRARMEAKRTRPTTSPFAGQSIAGAEAAYGTRSDVDPRTEERFVTPELDEAPRRRRPNYQPDDVETIRRLYGEGRTQQEIAEHLGGAAGGWHQRRVSKVMKLNAIEARPRGRRGAPGVPPEADERTCAECGDLVGHLSARDWCDACELDDATANRPATPAPLAILETPAALAAVPSPTLLEHPDVRALLAALADALDTSAEVVFADVRNATDRLRARSVANRRTAAATRGRTA
ncbi:MAG: hypothetical protein K0S43_389 [Cellulosimicrobium sp.]|jgi:DNA-binding CsgD family transcriptional regulator|nr:hypothetical protein [Cellulosimicrobium sp.]